ncbi:flagellin [Methylorubrum aminovorans]|uniref:flagellin N-terminal helical domain-containing protein n=1 Tax=Methylorubrum aminovorans TaxID=269069 RepID=UPI003C2C4F79
MSSSITLSAATRQNLLSLQDTANLLSTTQTRLSTGKKVNSALDNPVNFFTAQALTNRSSDLSGLLDSISTGVQTIQAANQGITSIQKLVDSAKSTATQALSTKSTATGASAAVATLTASVSLSSALATGAGGTGAAADGTHDFSGTKSAEFTVADANGASGTTTVKLDAASFGNTVTDLKKVTADEILAQINKQLTAAGGAGAQAIASLTTDGRLNFSSTATGSDAQVTVTVTGGDTDIGFGVVAGTSANAKGIDATDGSAKAKANGVAVPTLGTTGVAGTNAGISIQLGDGAVKNLTFGAGPFTGAQYVTEINNQIQSDVGLKGKLVAEFSAATNQLSIRTTASGADQKVTVKGTGSVDIGFGTSGDAGVTASGTGATSANGTNARAALAKQFNELLTQITQQARDASYNGVNLLYRAGSDPKENTLHMSFNEKDDSSLDIKGVKFDADGLGIREVTGSFSSDDDIKAALSQLTTASSTLRSQSSTFGSNLTVVQNRQDFTKNLVNILDTGSANLTNADMNEEAANSQALSTRNSLAISALSLANQAQQGILQLLR